MLVYSSIGFSLDYRYIDITETGKVVDGEVFLRMDGTIKEGDYKKLLMFLAGTESDAVRFIHSRGRVSLNSNGGSVSEAIKIANLFDKANFFVSVDPRNGQCLSSCFLLYISANTRLAWGKSLGIHRPYLDPVETKTISAENLQDIYANAFLEMRTYLEKYNIPTEITDKMLRNSSQDIYWLNEEEISQKIGFISPWYEEYLISKCELKKSTKGPHNANAVVKASLCGNSLLMDKSLDYILDAAGIGVKK
jgi:hypothetical protein